MGPLPFLTNPIPDGFTLPLENWPLALGALALLMLAFVISWWRMTNHKVDRSDNPRVRPLAAELRRRDSRRRLAA